MSIYRDFTVLEIFLRKTQIVSKTSPLTFEKFTKSDLRLEGNTSVLSLASATSEPVKVASELMASSSSEEFEDDSPESC